MHGDKKKEALASSLNQIFCLCKMSALRPMLVAPRQKAKKARQRQTVSFVGLLALARRKEG